MDSESGISNQAAADSGYNDRRIPETAGYYSSFSLNVSYNQNTSDRFNLSPYKSRKLSPYGQKEWKSRVERHLEIGDACCFEYFYIARFLALAFFCHL